MFVLIVDIHVISDQLTALRAVSRAQIYNSLVICFIKLSADQSLVSIDRRLNSAKKAS